MAREAVRETNGAGRTQEILLKDSPYQWRLGLYLLDKYGIPLLMLGLVIAALVVMYRQNRDDAKAQQAAFISALHEQKAESDRALDRNTQAIEKLNVTSESTGKLIERLSDRLDAHLSSVRR